MLCCVVVVFVVYCSVLLRFVLFRFVLFCCVVVVGLFVVLCLCVYSWFGLSGLVRFGSVWFCCFGGGCGVLCCGCLLWCVVLCCGVYVFCVWR